MDKKTIDEAITLFENEIAEYQKAIIYLRTKYETNSTETQGEDSK